MDIRRTRPLVIFGIALLLTGAGSCLRVRLKEEVIYGIIGQPVNLEVTYRGEASNKLHSITWKVDKEGPTRILQYIVGKNKTLPSSPYRDRIQFDSKTGSLVLLSFAESDRGTYQITVTADDGAEDKASTEVTVYEPIGGIMVTMTPNETSSARNVSLICSVEVGTNPEFSWTKDGMNITETGEVAVGHSGPRLVLQLLGPEDCGTYTCSVSNLLSRLTHSLNLAATSNFPQCEVRISSKKRHHQLLPVLLGILAALLMGLGIYLTQAGKIALQCARSTSMRAKATV